MVKKNVKIVVLGDIGRSPRMQYHALSLAEMGHKVDMLGYGETDPMELVKSHSLISYHYLLPVPQIPFKLINYMFKTVFQAINLLFLLLITNNFDILLVQNPPAVPALLVCWIFSKISGAKLIIDWHNYSHTIMALNTKINPLVQIIKKIEKLIGQRADHNFCVTNAMKEDLNKNWHIGAITLYDRPSEIFQPLDTAGKVAFLTKFAETYKDFCDFFEEIDGTITLKETRPGLLISSTSWTEDEDFSVLLKALQDYESHCSGGNTKKLPHLYCVITGKGLLKQRYLNKIANFNWKFVKIFTPWLESEDYPKILASSDLGVSLHYSSSGLDLPMKVVDMFGCGLPVCAYDFKCLSELVRHGENSYKFNTWKQLSLLIMDWFEDFPKNVKQQETERKFKEELKDFQKIRWRENWTKVASKLFK